jgi:hypothetical protein
MNIYEEQGGTQDQALWHSIFNCTPTQTAFSTAIVEQFNSLFSIFQIFQIILNEGLCIVNVFIGACFASP